MAISIRLVNFKNAYKKFRNVSIIQLKNLHINAVPLSTNLSVTQKIFNEQLKNVHKCKDFKSKFEVAHHIAKSVLSDNDLCLGSTIICERNERIIDYNVIGGKQLRMRLFLKMLQHTTSKSKLTDEFILRSWILGHLTLMMASSFIKSDDIPDNSEMSRMKPTSDALMLCNGIQIILKTFFSSEPYYLQCLELFTQAYWTRLSIAQLECKAIDILGKNKEYCTWATFDTLSAGLISCSVFKLPILAAINMAGVKYDHAEEDLERVFAVYGYALLAQNNYKNTFYETSGEFLNEDIKLGKISWFVLTALENCDYAQKNILHECYGKNDPECINAVLDVYNQLNLKKKYIESTITMSRDIMNCIHKVDDINLREPLLNLSHYARIWFLERIYNLNLVFAE